MNFLNNKNRHEEANKIIKENINISAFREIIFNEELTNKNYEKAIDICNEGIKIAQKSSHFGLIHIWQEKLLLDYETINDIDNIRKNTLELFNNNKSNLNYYRKLKKNI